MAAFENRMFLSSFFLFYSIYTNKTAPSFRLHIPAHVHAAASCCEKQLGTQSRVLRYGLILSERPEYQPSRTVTK